MGWREDVDSAKKGGVKEGGLRVSHLFTGQLLHVTRGLFFTFHSRVVWPCSGCETPFSKFRQKMNLNEIPNKFREIFANTLNYFGKKLQDLLKV